MTDIQKLRAWWFHRQGLDGSLETGAIAESLARCGWARSVAGASPYLGFFSRVHARRQAVDEALARQEIHELPAARGCTYVVPRQDYGLALSVGRPFADDERKVARKLGVTDDEVAKLSAAVVAALAGGPLDPDDLKQALGPRVRNLGDDGKKKGITTTLPLALGELQSEGRIRRIPTNGRLDQQRYRYGLWDPPKSVDDPFVALASRYFEWIAPAALAEFQWFSGLGAKAAKAAIEPLKLAELDDGRLIPPSLAKEFASFKTPAKPQYALVGSIDGILLLRRDLKSVIDPCDLEANRIGLGGLGDLPSHAILDRGRVIGLWEYDPETESIAWATFTKPDAALKKTVKEMEEFVRQDLGDARSFSLDSPKSRVPRIKALRAGL